MFLFSLSVFKKQHRKNVNPSLFMELTNKMNEKRSREYQNMGPEYVTWQINSRILELLLKRFYCLIFALSVKF